MTSEILLITGTDTGVGKTVLSALLLAHARATGINAVALKPFCSGSRSDSLLLHALARDSITLDQVNPFHFSEPLTPLLGARKRKQTIPLRKVAAHIRSFANRSELLLVEGAGGLLAPLGENRSKPYSNLTLLKALDCETIVVAANKLGTINHTLLTIDRLKHEGVKVRSLILSDLTSNPARRDPSAHHNLSLLQELLPSTPIHQLPFLGPALNPVSVIKAAHNYRRLLAQILL